MHSRHHLPVTYTVRPLTRHGRWGRVNSHAHNPLAAAGRRIVFDAQGVQKAGRGGARRHGAPRALAPAVAPRARCGRSGRDMPAAAPHSGGGRRPLERMTPADARYATSGRRALRPMSADRRQTITCAASGIARRSSPYAWSSEVTTRVNATESGSGRNTSGRPALARGRRH